MTSNQNSEIDRDKLCERSIPRLKVRQALWGVYHCAQEVRQALDWGRHGARKFREALLGEYQCAEAPVLIGPDSSYWSHIPSLSIILKLSPKLRINHTISASGY